MPHCQFLGILLLLLSGRSFRVQSLALPVGIEHAVRRNAPASIESCLLNGNSDLYGLGIRLGVYFQLISTLLANHFLPDALGEAWDANTIFLLSIFVAVIKSSIHINNLTAPEAFFMYSCYRYSCIEKKHNIYFNEPKPTWRGVVIGLIDPRRRVARSKSKSKAVKENNPQGHVVDE
jgi:hypothetical protein